MLDNPLVQTFLREEAAMGVAMGAQLSLSLNDGTTVNGVLTGIHWRANSGAGAWLALSNTFRSGTVGDPNAMRTDVVWVRWGVVSTVRSTPAA